MRSFKTLTLLAAKYYGNRGQELDRRLERWPVVDCFL